MARSSHRDRASRTKPREETAGRLNSVLFWTEWSLLGEHPRLASGLVFGHASVKTEGQSLVVTATFPIPSVKLK